LRNGIEKLGKQALEQSGKYPVNENAERKFQQHPYSFCRSNTGFPSSVLAGPEDVEPGTSARRRASRFNPGMTPLPAMSKLNKV
jgi:hypothetical protein